MAKKPLPTADEFRQFLKYDPATGVLTWTEQVRRHGWAGKPAGSLHSRGYLRLGLFGRDWYCHRIAWLLHYGEWPELEIDHINHCKTDNRICNLRSVTHAENVKNMPRQRRNKSGVPGVIWSPKKLYWRVQIGGSGTDRVNLPSEHCLGRAIRARRAAEKKHGYRDFRQHG